MAGGADDDEPSDDEGDFAERWTLVILSVLTSLAGMSLTLLMLGAVAVGEADALAPLLSMVVLMCGVMGIGAAASAIVLGKRGGWPAMGFALFPCAVVLLTWAWAIRTGRWGVGG